MIHVILPEEKKYQTRKAMHMIHPILSQSCYPEVIQWRAIENSLERDFTVTDQSSIAADQIKYKQITFLQDLYSTSYKHMQKIY